MWKWGLTLALMLPALQLHCWGFYGHRLINEHAIYLLPPEMLVLYRKRINYLRDHAADADKRRYILKAEAPRHYIDLDRYGVYPFPDLPRKWDEAEKKYGLDSLTNHGILPWRILEMMSSLTGAFKKMDGSSILRLSADLGHYIGDAHVPLHTSSNHNGQFTNQHGIHAFWESRLPELLAEKEWDFFIDRAAYIRNPAETVWKVVLESAAAVDSVLTIEARLSDNTHPDLKYAYEWRNRQLIRQYSGIYSLTYNRRLNGMVERRLRQAIHITASCWYTAWINAGQPDLSSVHGQLPPEQVSVVDSLTRLWLNPPIKSRSCD